MKHSIPETASKFLEEIGQFFVKNEKVKTSNLLAKLISMMYKDRGNIREYIMEMSNLASKLKSLKLEFDEDLIVHFVLISLLAQSCLWSRSDDEKFILVGDDNKVVVELIETFKLQLKTGFHLDLFKIFVVPSFSLDKFVSTKIQNVVCSGFLIDNLYTSDVVSFRNKILQIGSRGTKIQRLVSNEILEPLDLSNFKVCVECIKGKQTNIRKLGCLRTNINICGPFPTTSWNGQQYFITSIDDYSRYDYLYLIHEKSQSLDVFKSFKAEVELQLGKKIKVIKFDHVGEYYGRYDGSREQRPRPFVLFLKECGIVLQYTMLGKPSMNDGEALKTTIYIYNRVPTKTVNKTPYELLTSKKPSIKHLHIWGCLVEARPYRLHERKLDSRTISYYFIGYAESCQEYKFHIFFEMGNARILEEVEFEKEENTRNVIFEEEFVNDIGQVLVPIIIQETTPVIRDNIQTIVLDIVLEQDYDEILPQTPIEQPQQPQEVSLRISIRERRQAIPDDYIVFLQEYEDDIGLTEYDPINFCQVMQSSKSQKWIDAMKDEMKSMQDNDVWDLIELLEGVKPVSCKWIFKTKKDSKGNIDRYKAYLVAKDFT
ncbi:hypothetical protein CR513_52937, partial [Mucuna pruriens]